MAPTQAVILNHSRRVPSRLSAARLPRWPDCLVTLARAVRHPVLSADEMPFPGLGLPVLCVQEDGSYRLHAGIEVGTI